MLSRIRYIIAISMLLAGAVSAQPVLKGPYREVDMGCYTVISNLKSERAIERWVEEFDLTRRAAQQLLGIKDDQILPLTILLLDGVDDFRQLLPPNAQVNFAARESETLGKPVGLGRQPMMALAKEWGGPTDVKARGVVTMWLMTSAGIHYDQWARQGFLDLFSNAKIKRTYVRIGGSDDYLEDKLIKSRDWGLAPAQRFALNRRNLERGFDWIVMDYLLLRNRRWEGMQDINTYERRVARGQPKNEAFEQVFGHSVPEMDELMQKHLKKRDFHQVKVRIKGGDREVRIEMKPMRPVWWNLELARFMVQESGVDRDVVRGMIERAVEEMPNDPRPYEVQWLYGLMTNQPGLSATALTHAIKLGTKRTPLCLQWCIDVINDRIRTTRGFIIEPGVAVKAADMLEEIIARDPEGLLPYRLLAQFIPSISPARDRDRQAIKQAMKSAYSYDQVLEAGMAAWLWRDGQLDAAEAAMQPVMMRSSPIKFTQDYINWLDAQIVTDKKLQAIGQAVAHGDYPQAAHIMDGLRVRYALQPFLKARLQPLRTDMANYHLLEQARAMIRNGQRGMAGSLVQDLQGKALPDWLRTLVDEVAAELRQPAAASAG